jgi:hypothetical protein
MDSGFKKILEGYKGMYQARIKVEKGSSDVWDYILTHYEDMKNDNITPLFVTKSASDGVTTFIVDAKDADSLSEIIFEHFSKIDTVQNINVVSLMKPMFFAIPPDLEELNRYTVSLKCKPSEYESIYSKIAELRPSENTYPTYAALTLQDSKQDILLSLLSPSMSVLEGYIDEWLSPIEGVTNMNVSTVSADRKLATKFEWKRTVHPITVWESLTSRDYEDNVYKDVNQGC